MSEKVTDAEKIEQYDMIDKQLDRLDVPTLTESGQELTLYGRVLHVQKRGTDARHFLRALIKLLDAGKDVSDLVVVASEAIKKGEV